MPTSAGHCSYMLFINDYKRYTFVWFLPDKKLKTGTSAHHTDVRQGENPRDLYYHNHHRTLTTIPPSIFTTTMRDFEIQ